MRLPIAILASCLLSGAVLAQTEKKVWTAAPVPGNLPQDASPADRAGNNIGPDTSSPFSSLPSGTRTGGQQSNTTRDGGGPGANSGSPNLSR